MEVRLVIDKTLQLTRDRFARLLAEDRFNRQERYQPTFTLAELAKWSKTPYSTMMAWALEGNIGRVTKRNGHPARVVTLKEIQRLADEFNWLPGRKSPA